MIASLVLCSGLSLPLTAATPAPGINPLSPQFRQYVPEGVCLEKKNILVWLQISQGPLKMQV